MLKSQLLFYYGLSYFVSFYELNMLLQSLLNGCAVLSSLYTREAWRGSSKGILYSSIPVEVFFVADYKHKDSYCSQSAY